MWFAEESSAVMVSLSLPLLKVSTERAEGSCETRKHPPLAAPYFVPFVTGIVGGSQLPHLRQPFRRF